MLGHVEETKARLASWKDASRVSWVGKIELRRQASMLTAVERGEDKD